MPFNAIPFRDAVQQFCEKHLDKIKHYIDYVSTRLPIPIKATSEGKIKKIIHNGPWVRPRKIYVLFLKCPLNPLESKK